MRPVLEAVSEHLDGAAGLGLPPQVREELAPGRTVGVEGQGRDQRWLGRTQEGAELNEVDAVLAIVGRRVKEQPAGATRDRGCAVGRRMGRREKVGGAGHRAHHVRLEALLRCVGGYGPCMKCPLSRKTALGGA